MSDFLGVPSVFDAVGEARFEDGLTVREQRLLVGLGNVEVLEAGGRDVELAIRVADEDEERDLGSLMLRGWRGGEPVRREVRIVSDTAEPEEELDSLRARYWRLRRDIERRYPLAYDRLRQLLLARRERLLQDRLIERSDGSYLLGRIAPPSAPVEGAPRAVLIGMHWLEIGGAEKWAIETVAMVADAGLIPVVITDRVSKHPLLARDPFDRAVFIPLDWTGRADNFSDELLRSVVERFDVRGVLVHHCGWLYDRLGWLKSARPETPIVDTLHIIEYAGGGYPAAAVHQDRFITTHHVISPALQDWLVARQKVQADKVVMAPLLKLAASDTARASHAARPHGEPFTIAFVVRFVRQKRPYLFLRLVKSLLLAGVPVRAIMHGDGELEETTRLRISSLGLEDVIEVRPHGRPVADTFADADLLVVSSQNEGITLTTMEAIVAGTPVLSADVGSQRTLVPDAGLVPRDPRGFLRQATATIASLAEASDAARSLWEDERRLVEEFAGNEDASNWMRRVISAWAG